MNLQTKQMQSQNQLVGKPTCLNRKSCKIFLVFGCMALILQFHKITIKQEHKIS